MRAGSGTGGGKPPRGCWELNLGPLEEQHVLVTVQHLPGPEDQVYYSAAVAASSGISGSFLFALNSGVFYE